MKGVEYRVEQTGSNELYIIVKQFRCSQTIVRKLDVYFILHNRVYRSPTCKALIVAKLGKCCRHLQNALQGLTCHGSGDSWDDSDGLLEISGENEINGILRTLVGEFGCPEEEGLTPSS
mmetsp:Transcript_18930/g.30940  ORF Transcript_18930/g.30940 Transcript_18930/m.30940 type:complete len:119 (+) Transcript_18930:323-679(+)